MFYCDLLCCLVCQYHYKYWNHMQFSPSYLPSTELDTCIYYFPWKYTVCTIKIYYSFAWISRKLEMAPGQVQVPQKSLSWLLLAVTLAYKLLDTSNLHEYIVQLRLRECGLRGRPHVASCWSAVTFCNSSSSGQRSNLATRSVNALQIIQYARVCTSGTLAIRLDPPINSRNWISCVKLDHAL